MGAEKDASDEDPYLEGPPLPRDRRVLKKRLGYRQRGPHGCWRSGYCGRCGKPRTPENTTKSERGRPLGRCRTCVRAHAAAYRKTPKGRARKARATWSELGIDPAFSWADYERLLADQGGVCAMCGKLPLHHQRLRVDHDHKTGKVRALLHDSCNLAAGRIEHICKHLGPEKRERVLNFLRRTLQRSTPDDTP